MAATLEELDTRLQTLEEEVRALRQLLERRAIEETSAERGLRMLREAKTNQAVFAGAWARVMEAMGIRGEPIGAEQLQKLMIAEGVNPGSNEFSRGIIEMREE